MKRALISRELSKSENLVSITPKRMKTCGRSTISLALQHPGIDVLPFTMSFENFFIHPCSWKYLFAVYRAGALAYARVYRTNEQPMCELLWISVVLILISV